ncbi:MAG TPA: hypothetical protein VIV60_00475, partial [Polyangiaceae bacterium]
MNRDSTEGVPDFARWSCSHVLQKISLARPRDLARPREVLYLVIMRNGNLCGYVLLGFLVTSLLDEPRARAQSTPPDTAPVTATPVPVAPPQGTPSPNEQPASAMAPLVPTPAAQTQPPPPVIDLHKDPPLPPPVIRTDHNHDGFYVRLSLGFGNLGTTMNAPDSGAVKASGSTLAIDGSVGYAVKPGIVLGGNLLL